MEKKYIIALLVGIFIYLGAVSGIYLVFKPNIEYRKKQKKKMQEKQKNAMDMARKAKELKNEGKGNPIEAEKSSIPDSSVKFDSDEHAETNVEEKDNR